MRPGRAAFCADDCVVIRPEYVGWEFGWRGLSYGLLLGIALFSVGWSEGNNSVEPVTVMRGG